MGVISNIEIIDNLIIGRVEPHIYAFTTMTIPNYLKVGDTYRPVEKRLDEWRVFFPNLQRVFSEKAVIENTVYFRDYSVHDYLINVAKRVRLTKDIYPNVAYSKEFFKDATCDDVSNAIADIRESYAKGDNRYKFFKDGTPVTIHYNHEETFKPRQNQQDAIDRFIEAKNKGRNNLLMYAVMRFGKSFTSMCCATAMEARLVLVVSGKADVKAEWKRTVEGHKRFIDYEFLTSDDLQQSDDILSTKLKSSKVVVFLTLQDLQGDIIKKKHREIFSNQIDLLIVDETHFAARAKEYGKVLYSNKLYSSKREAENDCDNDDETIEEADNKIKAINARIRIHLSGTPYRILMGSEFSKDDIIAFCQYADIVKAQEEYDLQHLGDDDYKEWDNPYYGFPQMIRFAFNPSEAVREKLSKLKQGGVTYTLSELFRPVSISKDNTGNRAHCKFIHEKEVLDLLKVIDGSKEDANVLSFLNYDKIIEGKLCRHIVFVLPYRASCDALEMIIKEKSAEFINLPSYNIINISGVDSNQDVETVKKIIEDYERADKKTITLTVNKMLTGTTVPQWDTMVYLKDTSSPQEYDQAIFRLQNQYIKTSIDDEGNVIKHNMKPQTLLVDFAPDRMFRFQEQKSKIYNVNTEHNGNDNLEQRIIEDLRISPIITINNGRINRIEATNIIDAVRHYSENKSVLDEATDVIADYSLLNDADLKAAIKQLNPVDAKKGLEIKPATDEDDEDYEIPDDYDSENEDAPEEGKNELNPKLENEEANNDDWKNKISTLYALILFYSFLTDSEVKSLADVISSIKNRDENKRIAKNTGLSFKLLVRLRQRMSPFILSDLEYKIQNINTLLKDERLDPIKRAQIAVSKFGRLSDSEIVTPHELATKVIEDLHLSKDDRLLDIASKQGEFAYAVYESIGVSCVDNIVSIPTSPLAYEFTLKVYKLLGLNTSNVISEYTAYDLLDNEKKEIIINKLKDMNFNYVVGNPPYQDQGGSGGNNDAPIYQDFCSIADKVTNGVSSLVIKASWFSAGRENLLGNFRHEMLTSKQVKKLVVYSSSREIFSNVEIKGGICYYLKDKNYVGPCDYTLIKDGETINCKRNLDDFDILIREPMLNNIVRKVSEMSDAEGVERVDTIISSDTPFGIPSNPRTSKKHPFSVFTTQDENHNILLFHIEKLHRKIEYCSKEQIKKHVEDIPYDKVFVPCSGGSGDDKMVLGVPELAPRNSVCSQSYLYAKFNSAEEAANFMGYMKTKFFRMLVAAIKITQACPKKVYRFVPMQDYTRSWTDQDLYKKYNLTDEEIAYIEKKIDKMN